MNLYITLLLLASANSFKNFIYKTKKYSMLKNQYDIIYNSNEYVYDYIFNKYIYIDKKMKKIFNDQKLKNKNF